MALKQTYPNQKMVTVEKELCDKAHLYTAINLEAMETAAKDLDGNAFKLWCYFAKNTPNYTFALSNVAVKESFGIKKDAYDNAVSKLIAKGYLERKNGNHFVFREKAPEKREEDVRINNIADSF